MSIPPIAIKTARIGWKWQWDQLMNGLAPCDKEGNYLRPPSEHKQASTPQESDLQNRKKEDLPCLIVGRSCPWAHRTRLVFELRALRNTLNLLQAEVDQEAGLWKLNPKWLGCDSLLEVYQKCGQDPKHRATVPTLIDPVEKHTGQPKLIGNESAQLVQVLNKWPSQSEAQNLCPKHLEEEIDNWQKLLQTSVNDGVYRCGFSRNQAAYNNASEALFDSLNKVEKSLRNKGPWLCGNVLTLADVRLFPTLIRWEMVYMPLFGCSQKPLWFFPRIWEWRKKFFLLPNIAETCDAIAWRKDYFGALFPLRPSNIVPNGPDLFTMITANAPNLL